MNTREFEQEITRERDELLTELDQVRKSHWELVQQLVAAHAQIEDMIQEIKAMERQIDRRTR